MIYDCVNLSPSEQIGMHSQPGWELSYILEGRGIRTVGDTESPFAEGDMVLVIPEMPHRWRFEESPGSGIRNITLTFGRDFLERAAALPGRGEAERHDGIRGDNGRNQVGHSKAAVADAGRRPRRTHCKRPAHPFDDWQRQGWNGGREVQEIRCSFWKRETGETFMSFVTRHRLETACRLLKDPSLQVSDVCYESGFNDIPHFNRSFRRRFGVSPSAYRARLKTE
ncbi:MAG TPA: helix-turn-helix domain-containing protein [Candidatus Cryptobacteroides excrementigallinarum]|nr:helix-turn-helix domain-containing protein [Candidatus Cryptobacteroides excrementigallinarum]